jgi:YD repeat-containing protein
MARYNFLNQLTNVSDSAGTSTTNWFNAQGLLYAVSNAFGRVQKLTFDLEDRATNSVDANGMVVVNT